jgi:murein L,D-transpeptidase YcbB/YkuD
MPAAAPPPAAKPALPAGDPEITRLVRQLLPYAAAAEPAAPPPDAQPKGRQKAAAPPPPPPRNLEADDKAAAGAFYAGRDALLWVEGAGLSARALAVIEEMKRAGEWGLDPAAFALPAPLPASASRDDKARAEAALTLAALKYARHARGGRIENPARQLSSYLDRLPQLRDPKTVIAELAAAPDAAAYLRGLHPKHPQFEKLRQRYLAMLRGSEAKPEHVNIPAGPMIKPGMKHPDVALLRQRLSFPAAAGSDATLYDPPLVERVKAFQKEKGQSGDGYVGNATRAAMNDFEVASPNRLRANMEMYRWLPDDLGDLRVEVNVPEFMFRVWKGGAVIHEERVITGLPDKQTPIFSDEMELVTFHPRWNVPNSIKVKELYPSLARGGTYVQKQGLRLLYNGRPVSPDSVDWYSADIRKFEVFQPPGPNNVLGLVKFGFPNRHEVYMHDTNSKNLFEQDAPRAFSHGCMRVRNPLKFAEIVLGADKGWDAAKIQEIVSAPPVEMPVQLDRKLPVHVTYFTAVIGADGRETLHRDVYGHEQRVALALEGRWNEIVVGADHLAPVKVERSDDFYNPFETFMQNVFGGF